MTLMNDCLGPYHGETILILKKVPCSRYELEGLGSVCPSANKSLCRPSFNTDPDYGLLICSSSQPCDWLNMLCDIARVALR